MEDKAEIGRCWEASKARASCNNTHRQFSFHPKLNSRPPQLAVVTTQLHYTLHLVREGETDLPPFWKMRCQTEKETRENDICL
ncbi:hypothetical protein OUZ56_004087 [Daphnia magna]|uniref:Uncharacterized protein n=1 Tax=Daphnia magna TaxID=35525 RepID=A0ABQ9YNW9_9CRUS|nr:hypothetical protein OUZ56_004087 [Daphnia magna]